MSLSLLWTDKCLLSILIAGIIWLVASLRKIHVRKAFQYLFQQPIAVSAGIVLSVFLWVGILDCIRVQLPSQPGSAVTIIDMLFSSLTRQDEATYSAPFALNSFTPETISNEGIIRQVYPRLQYPPASLQTAKQKRLLIAQVIIQALLLSVLVIVAAAIIANKWIRLPRAVKISALLTLFICIWVCLSAYGLSKYFHVFGTGKIGQDIFYYAVKSIRTGLIIGLLTTVLMLPLALFLGVSAGYFGGIVDDVIQYLYTTLSSIPGVLLITASVLSMQTYIANHPEKFTHLAASADARLFALCIILGVTSWTSLCRLLRAETLKLRETDFILAARAMGSSSIKIIFKHLFPNVMHIVLITLVLDFSYLVLAESVLSYVGVGVSPLTISWGNMINAARLELARDPVVWWPILSAFLFMFTLVLASNLFADAVRDAFDPHQNEI